VGWGDNQFVIWEDHHHQDEEAYQMERPTSALIESIPNPTAVRERICVALMEVQLLRDLLKVAERKDRQVKPRLRRVVADVS